MMSTSSRTRYPFTTSQWQELEHQALIFKYMISGMPIPPHLLCMIRRSYDSSLLLHQPPQLGGWSYYQMGSMKKVDPEPGRCRRTDGKKWRCSKEAYPDSKYCERHMHRGRNRSRKPVEFNSTSSTSSPKTMSVSSFTRNSNSSSPTISPSSSFKSLASESHQFTSYATGGHHHPFLYPQSSSRTIIGSDFSGQENVSSINNTLWESSAAFSDFGKGYRNERVEKLEVNELPFFSETSGTMRNISGTSLQEYGQLNINNLKQRSSYHEIGHSSFQIQSPDEDPRGQKHDYLGLDSDVKNEMSSFRLMEREVDDDDDKPKKVMHHFFDEWPLKDRFDSDEEKLSRNGVSSEIQLSISMPNSSDNFFFCKK